MKKFFILKIVLSLLFFPGQGFSKVFNVNSFLDIGDSFTEDNICETSQGNGECTLRAATQQANENSEPDIIILQNGDYELQGGANENDNRFGDLDLRGQITIRGISSFNTKIIGPNNDRVLHILPGAVVVIENLAIKNGTSTGEEGGGIKNEGALEINRCLITGNQTINSSGGGIFNTENGILRITDSTIFSNHTITSSGGGLLNDLGGKFEINNSTISSNTSQVNGAGIVNGGEGSIINSNIVFNTADGQGGGIAGGGFINLRNSILAKNTAGFADGTQDHTGDLTSQGFNIIGVNGLTTELLETDQAGDFNNRLDPKIEDILRDNGGPTLTHALLPGSPAINRGDNENCPKTDQRGFGRPVDGQCDIGAFEFGAVAIACGDGILQEDEGEECDDGNDNNEDECSNECTVNSNFSPEPGPGQTGSGGNGGCALNAKIKATPTYFGLGLLFLFLLLLRIYRDSKATSGTKNA